MAEYLITECPDHGTKATKDMASAVTYIQLAIGCRQDKAFNESVHLNEHAVDGVMCWECCNLMVIDPFDIMPYGCTCPTWDNPDDFDGPEDYEKACSGCFEHGTIVTR